MNVRSASLSASFLSLAFLSSLAGAQDAPSFEGTFKNDDVSLTLKAIGAADYSGTITVAGQAMAVEGANLQGGKLSGSFKGPDGEKFPFTLTLKDGKAELASEGNVQLLDAVAPSKPAKPNPLAKSSKPNPLAKSTKPNPLSRPKPEEDTPPRAGETAATDDDADRPAVQDISNAMDAQDWPKAWSLSKPLIEKGNVRALYLQGLMYQNGNGVPKDGAKATAAYERSGAGGFAYAYDNVGVMYRDGIAVEVDFARARQYFAKALALGNGGAALNLGALHANGQGTPRDYVRAHAYYQLSNDELASKNKAQLEGLMKPDEIARAKELADQFRAEIAAAQPKVRTLPVTGGIPVTFEAKPDGSFVVKTAPPEDGDTDPFNDPPFATIKRGDVLLKIDNKPVKGLTLAQVETMLAGEVDSLIQVELQRPGGGGINVAAPRVGKIGD